MKLNRQLGLKYYLLALVTASAAHTTYSSSKPVLSTQETLVKLMTIIAVISATTPVETPAAPVQAIKPGKKTITPILPKNDFSKLSKLPKQKTVKSRARKQ